jgi:hypothetical protein
MLCGGVAACLGVACVLCAVQNETELGGNFSASSPMMVEDRNMKERYLCEF